MKLTKGFTIIEILIALVVLGILTTMGIVGLSNLSQNTRSSHLSNDLVVALAYARSAAIERSTPVSICPASNSNLVSCSSSASWTNGWIIFLDPEADGQFTDSSQRLRVHDPLDTGSQINTSSTAVTFNSSGNVINGAGSFQVSFQGCSGNYARTISLLNTGLVNVTKTNC